MRSVPCCRQQIRKELGRWRFSTGSSRRAFSLCRGSDSLKLQLRLQVRSHDRSTCQKRNNPLGFHAPLHCTWCPLGAPCPPPPYKRSAFPFFPRSTIDPRFQAKGKERRPGERAEQEESAAASTMMDKAKEFVADKIAHIPKPEASLDGVSFKSMSRECITLHSNVNVSNPYSHRLPICEVTYTLKCAGKVVASGTMSDPGWIAASDTTKLEIPAKVPYDFLISLVKDVGRDWDIDYELEVGLTVDLPIVGNFTIPLSTSGEMKLPTLKDMF